MSITVPKRRWFWVVTMVSACLIAESVFAFFVFRHATGPRRYMEWRYEIHQDRMTDDELRQNVGEETYSAYREYVDSIPPLPPRTHSPTTNSAPARLAPGR